MCVSDAFEGLWKFPKKSKMTSFIIAVSNTRWFTNTTLKLCFTLLSQISSALHSFKHVRVHVKCHVLDSWHSSAFQHNTAPEIADMSNICNFRVRRRFLMYYFKVSRDYKKYHTQVLPKVHKKRIMEKTASRNSADMEVQVLFSTVRRGLVCIIVSSASIRDNFLRFDSYKYCSNFQMLHRVVRKLWDSFFSCSWFSAVALLVRGQIFWHFVLAPNLRLNGGQLSIGLRSRKLIREVIFDKTIYFLLHKCWVHFQ